MRLLIDQVANGFIVTRQDCAHPESYVFGDLDDVFKHMRACVAVAAQLELKPPNAQTGKAALNPFNTAWEALARNELPTAAMPRPPVLD